MLDTSLSLDCGNMVVICVRVAVKAAVVPFYMEPLWFQRASTAPDSSTNVSIVSTAANDRLLIRPNANPLGSQAPSTLLGNPDRRVMQIIFRTHAIKPKQSYLHCQLPHLWSVNAGIRLWFYRLSLSAAVEWRFKKPFARSVITPCPLVYVGPIIRHKI
jgi:hypothetical protein